jgi:hypothetical protein
LPQRHTDTEKIKEEGNLFEGAFEQFLPLRLFIKSGFFFQLSLETFFFLLSMLLWQIFWPLLAASVSAAKRVIM